MSKLLRAAALSFFSACLATAACAYSPATNLDGEIVLSAGEAVVQTEEAATNSCATPLVGSELALDNEVETCAFEGVATNYYVPTWTFRKGFTYLHRAQPDNQRLVLPTPGPGVISVGGDYNFDWAAGPDLSLIRRIGADHSLEMRYFGLWDWESPTIQYGAVGNVRIGSFSNFGATNLTSDYSTDMHNFEVNLRRRLSDRFSWLGGFRYVQLTDSINYDITFPAFTANYNWREDNQLYGGQLGADFDLWRLNQIVSTNAIFKGGVFGNHMLNDFTLRPSTGGVFDGGGEGSSTVLLGEIGVTTSIQLTDHFSVRGGYQMFWLDGLALASNNVARATANSSQAGIDDDGSLFLHGALMSFDAVW